MIRFCPECRSVLPHHSSGCPEDDRVDYVGNILTAAKSLAKAPTDRQKLSILEDLKAIISDYENELTSSDT